MSVCLPPRFDVNSSARPSGRKAGWLSYPGLRVMLTAAPTVSLPSTVSSAARKMSESGGFGAAADCMGELLQGTKGRKGRRRRTGGKVGPRSVPSTSFSPPVRPARPAPLPFPPFLHQLSAELPVERARRDQVGVPSLGDDAD